MTDRPDSPYLFRGKLAETDADVDKIIGIEEERQARKIIMIASESICWPAVREVMASSFSNLYAEGYPNPRMLNEERENLLNWPRSMAYHRRYSDWRYYKGTDYVNWVEALAITRCAELFANDDYSAEKIYVNVQSLSGAAANNAVYNAFVQPGDVVMGMDLSHGGHLTHGSPVNRSGVNFNVVPYHINPGTGRIDFKEMERLVKQHKPKMIIAGYSAYPWAVDWARFREICDMVPGEPARLVADIAHPVGLVVAGLIPSPIGYADAITFTTHKTLCGPRGACIVSTDEETAKKLDFGVFPGEQGGPHIHQIAAKAVAFKIAATPEFKEMQKQVIKNAQALAESISKRGLKIAYGGTDTHLALIDLKSVKTPTGRPLTGEIASRILDFIGITANKNTILGDESAGHPTAVRLGTTWVTQRGMREKEMDRIADIVVRALTGIHAYSYHFATGPAGRGKIDAGLFRELKQEVQALEAETAREFEPRANDTGYPHFVFPENREKKEPAFVTDDKGGDSKGNYICDLSNYPVFEITGERASAMISDIATANVFARPEQAAEAAFIFEKDARLLDDVALLKESPERYFVIGHPERGEKLLDWLRGNADGYLLFDEKEYFAKVQGPVVVNDRTNDFAVFFLAGDGAGKVLAACDICPELKPGEFTDTGNMNIGMLDKSPSGREAYVLLAGRSPEKELETKAGGRMVRLVKNVKFPDAEKVWETLSKNRDNFKLAGGPTERALSGVSETAAAVELYEKFPQAFDLTKTFFVNSRELREHVKLETGKKKYVYKSEELPPRKSCLYEEHLKLTRKSNIVPFAGWLMPVIYTSISEEHEAVRTTAGLFDVSHMGVIEVAGPYATRFLNLVTSNYLDWIRPGQAIYGYLLYPSGECVDDILMYKHAEDNYMIVANAVNAEKVLHWLRAVNSGGIIIDEDYPAAALEGKVTIRDLKDPSCGKDMRVDVALQGPRSLDILLSVVESDEQKLALMRLNRNDFIRTELFGIDMYVARTGYTGEKRCYEMYVHPDNAPKLWNGLLDAGKDFGIKPTGLGARDSTRTEAGLPLYGHELEGDFGVTPVEAGYGPFIKFHKPFFIGRKAMIQNDDERKMEIVRFIMDDPKIRMMKPGDPVASMRGELIGHVTSCTKAGSLQVGLAYILSKHAAPETKIGVYPLPRSGKVPAEGPKDKMKPGEKLLLYETGIVIPRFPEKGVMESTMEEYK
jgi:glycine cleavage system T protein